MSHTFVASWPVEDQDMTLADARREAEQYLPDLLFENGAMLVGEPRWRLADALTVGRPASDGIVLVMEAPAAPWTDPTRSRVGRHRRVSA